MTRDEALLAVRKLLRTFASAPDPRRRAQEIAQALSRCPAFTSAERGQILAFNQWLADKPSTSQLKPRCEDLLGRLA